MRARSPTAPGGINPQRATTACWTPVYGSRQLPIGCLEMRIISSGRKLTHPWGTKGGARKRARGVSSGRDRERGWAPDRRRRSAQVVLRGVHCQALQIDLCGDQPGGEGLAFARIAPFSAMQVVTGKDQIGDSLPGIRIGMGAEEACGDRAPGRGGNLPCRLPHRWQRCSATALHLPGPYGRKAVLAPRDPHRSLLSTVNSGVSIQYRPVHIPKRSLLPAKCDRTGVWGAGAK